VPSSRGTRWSARWAIVAVLGAGLGLRLVLALVVFPGAGHATDLGLFGEWASTLVRVGPGGFYAAARSANYPPGYMWVLWLVGALGNGVALLKTPAILADVAIGAVLYVAGRRWLGARVGLFAAALYLFVPVTWYDSALWGQVDAVGALVVLVSVVLLAEGWSELALASAGLAVLVKPQDAVVLVVVLPVLLRRHLLRIGSGPAPTLGPRLRGLDARVGGTLSTQGPVRLATSGLMALAVVSLTLLPFDIVRFAPASLADGRSWGRTRSPPSGRPARAHGPPTRSSSEAASRRPPWAARSSSRRRCSSAGVSWCATAGCRSCWASRSSPSRSTRSRPGSTSATCSPSSRPRHSLPRPGS